MVQIVSELSSAKERHVEDSESSASWAAVEVRLALMAPQAAATADLSHVITVENCVTQPDSGSAVT